uniref:Uncharacterized protein n=1 Tax=Peronospora matthiolae TaxID=2874970 RepID=A0AAV1V697_9STRA
MNEQDLATQELQDVLLKMRRLVQRGETLKQFQESPLVAKLRSPMQLHGLSNLSYNMPMTTMQRCYRLRMCRRLQWTSRPEWYQESGGATCERKYRPCDVDYATLRFKLWPRNSFEFVIRVDAAPKQAIGSCIVYL